MVIGNGSIAKIFKNDYLVDTSVVIFASGVSNSSESNQDEFLREKLMLQESISKFPNSKFIYFSSVYVNLVLTPYYKHKLNMEEIIRNSSKNFLIIRLPQIISDGGNKNNLINYFVTSLKNNNQVQIQKNTKRSIIDIEDVKKITDSLVRNENNKVLTFSHIEYVTVLSLFISISNIIGSSPRYVESEPLFNIPKIKNSIEIDEIITNKIDKLNYTNKLLKKYIS